MWEKLSELIYQLEATYIWLFWKVTWSLWVFIEKMQPRKNRELEGLKEEGILIEKCEDLLNYF